MSERGRESGRGRGESCRDILTSFILQYNLNIITKYIVNIVIEIPGIFFSKLLWVICEYNNLFDEIW